LNNPAAVWTRSQLTSALRSWDWIPSGTWILACFCAAQRRSLKTLNNIYRLNSSPVGVATGWKARVRFPAVQDFSFLHSVQTGSGTQPASYPMGTGGSFPGGKAAGAWSWPLTSIQCRGQDRWSYTSTPPYVFMP
jgi:hypothetical protein